MLKNFLLSCALIATASNSYAQIPSSCVRSSAFSSAFDEDSKELAIMNMLASGTADSNSISVIPSYSQDVFRALAAVANTASFLSEADSVFNLYCIHNDIEINSLQNSKLYVSLDSNVPWTADWLNHSTPSGNTTIDNLLAGNTYSLSQPFFSMPHLVLLTFDSIVNVKPVIEQLTGLNGVNYIEGNPLTGDANSITHHKVGNTSYLDFTIGWDDCSAGCIKERTWSFSVDLTTCSVFYLGVAGSNTTSFFFSPPYQPNCNILLSTPSTFKEIEEIQVYPNPTSDLITIEGDLQEIKLYNSMGSLILNKSIHTTKGSIDLSTFANGVYLLVVNNVITKTIVKQ
jgi:hypothetical protein